MARRHRPGYDPQELERREAPIKAKYNKKNMKAELKKKSKICGGLARSNNIHGPIPPIVLSETSKYAAGSLQRPESEWEYILSAETQQRQPFVFSPSGSVTWRRDFEYK